MELEIINRNSENNLPILKQESYIKEEIMITDNEIDIVNISKDDEELKQTLNNEYKSNFQNILQKKNILIKKENVTLNINLENDLMNFQQESYIKEESMLSDISIFFEYDASNNRSSMLRNNISCRILEKSINQLSCDENINMNHTTEKNSDDEEIDVVNISEDCKMLDKKLNNIECNTVSRSNKKDTCASSTVEIVAKSHTIDHNNMTNDKHLSNQNKKRSVRRKQTTIFDFFNKFVPSEGTSPSTADEIIINAHKPADKFVKQTDARIKSRVVKVDGKSQENANHNPIGYEKVLRKCSVIIEKLPNITNVTKAVKIKKDTSRGILQRTKNKKSILSSVILICKTCEITITSVRRCMNTQCQNCRKQMQYQCLKCNYLRTLCMTTVYRHLRFVCGQNFYYCEHCSYRSRVKSVLSRHILANHTIEFNENGLAACAKCGDKFTSRRGLLNHQNLCGLEPFLKCTFCGLKTKYKRYLNEHLRRKHRHLKTEDIQKMLSIAKKKTLKLIDMNAFKPSNNERGVDATSKKFGYKDFVKVYCPECDVNFEKNNRNDRKCHQCGQIVHFQCLKCDRRFVTSRRMHSHLSLKCRPNEYFQCTYCNHRTLLKGNLVAHVKRMHTTVAPEDYVKCRKCGKEFRHRSDRQMHERLCGKEPDMQCEFCPYRTKYRDYFKLHVQNHMLHPKNGEATVNAASIDQTGDSLGILDNTSKSDEATVLRTAKIMRLEEKLRLQKLMKACCSKCKRRTKVFFGRTKCSKCTTEFSYRCGECDVVYTVQGELLKHIQHNHFDFANEPKKRPQCPECDKRFVLYEDLYQHRKLCDKAVNLQCDQCPYVTKMRWNLLRHLRLYHPELTNAVDPKQYACHECSKVYKDPNSLHHHKRFYCGKEPKLACDHCNFKSFTKPVLATHLHKMHVQVFIEKALECNVCGKQSRNIYTHATHVKNCNVK